MNNTYAQAAHALKAGQIGVIPTDTTYGLVCCATDRLAVERLYQVKQRQPDKSYIVLISSIDDVATFGISLSAQMRAVLELVWPGPVSVVLPLPIGSKFRHLQRGKESLALRLPNNPALQELVRASGPLAAPSANPEDLPPTTTIQQAREYFGEKVDFYVDGGTLDTKPSTLVRITTQGLLHILREGVLSEAAIQALIDNKKPKK